MSQKIGQIAEEKAFVYLYGQGLRLVVRNYNCSLGEIDLIMRDKSYLVFVEVRARAHTQFGGGIVSITNAKKQKIMKAASHFLTKNRLHEQNPLRFDVISLDGHSGHITWLKDAFGVDY
ncbi:MAG: YraN family protein [Legionella sp.]|nr:YraN family protein [Legionella sp.]